MRLARPRPCRHPRRPLDPRHPHRQHQPRPTGELSPLSLATDPGLEHHLNAGHSPSFNAFDLMALGSFRFDPEEYTVSRPKEDSLESGHANHPRSRQQPPHSPLVLPSPSASTGAARCIARILKMDDIEADVAHTPAHQRPSHDDEVARKSATSRVCFLARSVAVVTP